MSEFPSVTPDASTKPIGYDAAETHAARHSDVPARQRKRLGIDEATIIGSVEATDTGDGLVLNIGRMDATDPDAPAQFYGLLRLTPADRDRLIHALNEAAV